MFGWLQTKCSPKKVRQLSLDWPFCYIPAQKILHTRQSHPAFAYFYFGNGVFFGIHLQFEKFELGNIFQKTNQNGHHMPVFKNKGVKIFRFIGKTCHIQQLHELQRNHRRRAFITNTKVFGIKIFIRNSIPVKTRVKF